MLDDDGAEGFVGDQPLEALQVERVDAPDLEGVEPGRGEVFVARQVGKVGGDPGQVVGALNPTQQLPIQVALPLRNQGQAEELVKQLNDPSSANYGKYLSAAQFNKQFAPTQQQVAPALPDRRLCSSRR